VTIDRHDRRVLIGLTLLALALRAAWLRWPTGLEGDGAEYLQLATSLATSGRYSADGVTLSSYRPPLYPALLAACSFITAWGSTVPGSLFSSSRPLAPLSSLTSATITLVLWIQCLLGAATVTLVYFVARRMFDRKIAALAALFLAVAPMTTRYATTLLTETLFTFLLVAGIWGWTSHRPWIGGVALGVATLTRAALWPFIALLGLWGVIPLSQPGAPAFAKLRRGGSKNCRRMAIAALVIIMPWLARNVMQVGRLTIADAGWGSNLLFGTVDLHRGSNRWSQIAMDVGRGPQVQDSEERSRKNALTRIASNPRRWLLTRIRQYPWLFLDSGDYLPVGANAYSFGQALAERRLSTLFLKAAFVLANACALAAMAWGLWRSRMWITELAPLWTYPLFLAVSHLPMYVEPRYGLPLVPFVAIFAAVGVSSVLGRVRRLNCRSSPELSIVNRQLTVEND
jgi:hypothetical protein